MKIDILIVFEHLSRELESALLLEKKLKERGYSVAIVQASWSENYSHLIYQPKIIVVPWCYDEKEYDLFSHYKGSLKNNDFKVINLHCEQITNSDAISLMLPNGDAKQVYHLAWGEYFYEQLLSVGVEIDLICITGSPRLDFFREEYKSISRTKEELGTRYSLNAEKKWILLIGNFSYVTYSKEELQEIKTKGYKDIDVMTSLAKKTYYELIKWFELLCQQAYADQIEIIYRPHPSELITEELRKLEQNYSNFHIIKEFAVRDWIVNSDLCFSWCSTSAVEVSVTNIPIYNWRPFCIPDFLQYPLLESIPQVVNVDEFLSVVSDVISSSLNYDNENFIKQRNYFYAVDKKSAADKTVEYIESVICDEKIVMKRKDWLFFGIYKAITYSIKRFFDSIGILKRISRLNLISDAYVKKSKIEEYRNKIGKL